MCFDDGWVELPGLARSLSDTRRNLRSALVALGLFVGGLAAGSALDALGAPEALVVACSVVALGGLGYGGVLALRAKLRQWGQSSGDAAQARTERETGRTVQAAEGSPRWKRADSAAEMAGWLEGEVLVEADDVVGVEAAEDRASHVRHRVVVRLRDGSTRTYASPDKRLPRLLLTYRG